MGVFCALCLTLITPNTEKERKYRHKLKRGGYYPPPELNCCSVSVGIGAVNMAVGYDVAAVAVKLLHEIVHLFI